MPPLISAIPAALISGGVAAIEGATWAVVLESAATSLALGTIGNLLTPKPKSAGLSTATPVPFPFTMQPADSRTWLYGRGATGGGCDWPV